MEQRTFSVADRNTVVFKVLGSLDLTGWDQNEMQIQADEHTLRVEEEDGGTIRLVALRNCRAAIPAGIKVQIEKVGENAWLHNYPGKLEVERVNGGLTIEEVLDVQVERVSGDFSARRMANLSVGRVGGSCVVEEVREKLQIGKVGGDFKGQQIQQAILERVGGSAALQTDVFGERMRAGGDALVSLGITAGPDAVISAGGSSRVQLPAGARLNLKIQSSANSIVVDLAGKRFDVHEREYTYPMGAEMPTLSIEAGGSVRVTDEAWEPVDLHARFERAEKRAEEWGIQGMAAGMRAVEQVVADSQRIAEIASRAGQEAARHAEERVREVMRDLDLRFGGAPSTEAPVHGQAPETAQAPVEPAPPSKDEADANAQGVSEEERMFVLRMLQEKKITLEEAEKLLDALEGRS